MKNGILNELISTMKERIPQDMNLANTLADILCMGKEAVYRRLRGEVSFTIDEVALLSQKLGISIDQIVGSHVSNKVTFDLNLLHATSALVIKIVGEYGGIAPFDGDVVSVHGLIHHKQVGICHGIFGG